MGFARARKQLSMLHFIGFVVGVGLLELDDELLEVVEAVELVEEDVDDWELLEDDELVSGTPPGPATICRMFVVVESKLVGAYEIWLLSRSYTAYMAVRTVSPMIFSVPIEMQNWQVPVPPGNIASWVIGTAIVIPLNSKFRVSISD